MTLEPNERVSELNKRLRSLFGFFSHTSNPLWRIVFSHDEFEKRLVNSSPEGFLLLKPIVVVRPKYRNYINPPAYILERAMDVPPFADSDLVEKWSYEPVWVFKDRNGNNLPPVWPAIKMIIDSVYSKSARTLGAKYKDQRSGLTPQELVEYENNELDKLAEQLFGESSDIADSLHYQNAVSIPHKQFGES